MPRKLLQTLSIAMVILFTSFACEESVENTDETEELTNTLNESSVGNGKEGNISSYFYNFADNINAEFYIFDNTNYNLPYPEYLSLFGQEPPILTLKNFPEYLAEIEPSDVAYTQRSSIDTLPDVQMILQDSIEIMSQQYTNITALNWNHNEPGIEVEDMRYEVQTANGGVQSVVVHYSDTLLSRSYQAVVDTPLISSGIMFVDQSEWVDTTYSYTSSTIPFTHTFQTVRTQLNSELLMHRLSTDCNDNGQWDDAGYMDNGNGVWDPAEAFLDYNGTPGYQIDEPFQDRNCNGVRDTAEYFFDYGLDGLPNTADTLEGNGVYDLGEPFNDTGYGLSSSAEQFTDENEDGVAQSNELYILTQKPDNLLVSWEDLNNPNVMAHVEPGDSIIDRWGNSHAEIIETVTVDDVQDRTVDDMDSLVTLYTNQVIEHVPSNSGGDYFITKTDWTTFTGERYYDYLLFKENEHIYQLTHPTYFVPDGFILDFWASNDIVDEVIYFTVNGQLRDGEIIEEEYFDTTSVAIYKIEKSFMVEADTVASPAKLKRYYDDNGTTVCYGDEDLAVTDPSECPAADTTFFDCFKVTRTLTMTLVGTGVEFGSRDITWLARDMGIVRDELLIRWTEPLPLENWIDPFEREDEVWYGISKWELGKFTRTGNSGRLGRFLTDRHVKKLQDFQSLPEFENDPYKINHVFGFQRVMIPEE